MTPTSYREFQKQKRLILPTSPLPYHKLSMIFHFALKAKSDVTQHEISKNKARIKSLKNPKT